MLNRTAAMRPLARGVAVALGLALTWPTVAQVAGPAVPGQTPQDIDPAQRLPAVPPAVIDPSTLAVAASCPFTGKGDVTLRRIDVAGATLVSRGAIDAVLADLLDKPADAEVLCTARDRVARLYADQGEALAAVDIPQQTLTDGVLTLQVTEGRVRSVVIENESALGPSSALARAYLAQLDTGATTRWRDVERAFLLTREIPGAEIGFALRRSADDSADGLEVVASASPRRKVDIGVSVQNLGSEELGRESASLRLDANGFTPFGERTSLVLFSSLGGEQKVVQLLEEVRLGASGWTLLGDVAYGRSRPGGALDPLELEGRSRVARLGARYPMVKSRALAWDAGARLEAINQTNDLGFLRSFGAGLIPLFDEKLRVLAIDTSARWQSGPGLVAVSSLELRKGLGIWGASEAGDMLLSRPEGRPDFTSARIGAGARWTVHPSARGTPYVGVNGAAQWSNAPLPAYEEYQVGNYTVGRGFDPGAAAGDRALAAQVEAGWEVRGNSAVTSVFAFVDGARLWNRDVAADDATLRSVGVGARVNSRHGQFAVMWAAPRTGTVPGGPTPDSRVLVTFNHNFSIR